LTGCGEWGGRQARPLLLDFETILLSEWGGVRLSLGEGREVRTGLGARMLTERGVGEWRGEGVGASQ
jgi:hypothetical protein